MLTEVMRERGVEVFHAEELLAETMVRGRIYRFHPMFGAGRAT